VTQTDRRIIDNAMTTLAIPGPDRGHRNNLTPSRGSSYSGVLSGRLNLPPVRRVLTTACICRHLTLYNSPSCESPGFPSHALYQPLFFGSSFSRFPSPGSLERPRRLTFSVAHHDQLHPQIPTHPRSPSRENKVGDMTLGASGPSPQDPRVLCTHSPR